MRRNPSEAERKFWWLVRGRRLAGYKFKRQFLIGPYIADFACLEAKLAVELDGGQHSKQIAYDQMRDAYMTARGYRVLRFWNTELFVNEDGVVEMLLCQLKRPPHPNPLPQQGERGDIPTA
jgi:very-short-patch-repair endonuclease